MQFATNQHKVQENVSKAKINVRHLLDSPTDLICGLILDMKPRGSSSPQKASLFQMIGCQSP